MATRVKIFTDSAQESLEGLVNDFLAELESMGGAMIAAQFAAPDLKAGPNQMAVMLIYAAGRESGQTDADWVPAKAYDAE